MLWVIKRTVSMRHMINETYDQKNRLNETVLLSTKNICLNRLIRKYLQFYNVNFVGMFLRIDLSYKIT